VANVVDIQFANQAGVAPKLDET